VAIISVYSDDCILCSNAQKCAWKCVFTNHIPSAASDSESEFDHVNRIQCLKVGMLVYTGSRLSKCQAFDDLLTLCSPFCCETDCTAFVSLDTQEIERRQLGCTRNCDRNSLRFVAATIRSRDGVWKFYTCAWPKSRELGSKIRDCLHAWISWFIGPWIK